MLAKRGREKNKKNNLLSKHHWYMDCFTSVNLKAINYMFHVLTLMPAGDPNNGCAETVFCLFLAPGVLHSEGEFISLPHFSINLCFLWLGGK